MNGTAWPLVELVARVLEPDEREAVIGDLLEANETAWRALQDVSGLVLRRQTSLWKDGRPWLAGFGVALPCGYLLMYVSVSVTCTFARLLFPDARILLCGPTGHEGLGLLLCHIFLLIAWSWSTGYLLGSVSRMTFWASAAMALLPALRTVQHFPADSPLRVCIFLFIFPAILGSRRALRNVKVTVGLSSALAISVTVLMVLAWTSNALWILNWLLIWPVWYLFAKAWRTSQNSRTGSWPVNQASYTSAS